MTFSIGRGSAPARWATGNWTDQMASGKLRDYLLSAEAFLLLDDFWGPNEYGEV